MRSLSKRSAGPVLSCVFTVLSVLAMPAAEASVSYSFSPPSSGSGSSYTYTVGGYSVTATAWSSGTSSGLASGNLVQGNLTFNSGGLGVNNGVDTNEGNSPYHSIDSSGRVDLVLLDFGAGNQFNMTSFSTGWNYTDADLAVFAYTGSANLGTGLGSLSLTGLRNNSTGAVIQNACTVSGTGCTGSSGKANIATGLSISSRYWLVVAYNPVFSAWTGASGIDGNSDYFKLASVTGDVRTTVPLPATTALLGIGALAFWRRRQPGAGLG